MGFMDKVKGTASMMKDKAVSFVEEKNLNEKFGSAKESVKKQGNIFLTRISRVIRLIPDMGWGWDYPLRNESRNCAMEQFL